MKAESFNFTISPKLIFWFRGYFRPTKVLVRVVCGLSRSCILNQTSGSNFTNKITWFDKSYWYILELVSQSVIIESHYIKIYKTVFILFEIYFFDFFTIFTIFPIFVMLVMPFWNYHNSGSANFHRIPSIKLDSEWPKIRFYISPQLEKTRSIIPRKNLQTCEPP